MLHFEPITTNFKDLRAVKELYLASFSKAEQAPFWFILRRAQTEDINFYAYYDDDIFAGFAYFLAQDDVTYLGFIAISPLVRSKGYGSQIMNHIEECYPENRIILCIEKLSDAASNKEQRVKRRNFYLRNGYAASGLIVEHKGEDFELLVKGGSCDKEDFYKVTRKFVSPLLFPFVRPKLRSASLSSSD